METGSGLGIHLLKARGLTTNDVVDAIREQNVQVAVGSSFFLHH